MTDAPTTLSPSSVILHTSESEPYVEFFLALASGFALLTLALVQLVLRSRLRVARLAGLRKRLRLDVVYYLSDRWKKDRRRATIEKSVEIMESNAIKDPPQFDTRVLPAILSGAGGCARREARTMLDKARSLMPPRFASASMRSIAWYFRGTLDHDELLRFVAVFESVLLGVHSADGTEGDVTAQELSFLREYFNNRLLKEMAM